MKAVFKASFPPQLEAISAAPPAQQQQQQQQGNPTVADSVSLEEGLKKLMGLLPPRLAPPTTNEAMAAFDQFQAEILTVMDSLRSDDIPPFYLQFEHIYLQFLQFSQQLSVRNEHLIVSNQTKSIFFSFLFSNQKRH